MKLENMTVQEKINQLEGLIAKTDLDVDYAIQVAWKSNAVDTKKDARILIDNARTLFSNGRIDTLDYDVRNQAITNYSNKLDEYLRMFPEYAQDNNLDQGQTVHM